MRAIVKLWLVFFLSPGITRADHIDILIALNLTATQIVTGEANLSASSYIVGERVFGAEIEHIGTSFVTEDPGFNAVTSPVGGLPLPGSIPVSFTWKAFTIGSYTSNLYFWDGVGAVNFVPVSTGETLEASKAGGFSATIDGSATDVTGFVIANTSPSGTLHKHLDFELFGDGGDPAEGIYLAAMAINVSGYASSEPLFLVFNNGLSESIHEDAIDYVRLNVVPEPSLVLGMGALPLAALARWRRRRTQHLKPRMISRAGPESPGPIRVG